MLGLRSLEVLAGPPPAALVRRLAALAALTDRHLPASVQAGER